jgi:AAA+ ATPase superfamily predicted ATPase
LKNPERYISILRAISRGKKELKEIADYLELEQYQLTPYLRNLSELLDIISQSNPLYGKKKIKRYEIKDNFFKFWYRFVYPFQEQIQAGIIEPTIKRIYKEIDGFIGRIFEDIVMEFFLFMRGKKIKGMNMDFIEYGKWWEAGKDIDLVLKNRSSTIFVEVKFQNKKMSSRNFEELKKKSFKTSAGGKFKYILISKGGFEQELIDRKIQNLVLLDLNDLTEIMDEETKREKDTQSELSEWFGLSD